MTPDRLVYIIDDDTGFRESVSALLASSKIACIAYSSPTEFLGSYRSGPPDCAIVDLRMPEMSGLQLMGSLRRRQIDLPVIFVSAWADVGTAVQAMRAGAADFLCKPLEPNMFIDRVHEVLGDALRAAATRERRSNFQTISDGLTLRERQVMHQLTLGSSAQEVSDCLGLNRKTIYFHQKNLLRKLGLKDARQLILMAREGSDGEAAVDLRLQPAAG